MDAMEVLTKAREGMDLHTVFGEPITHDGLEIIPVARVRGAGGGGVGKNPAKDADGAESVGEGAGFTVRSTPVGVFVIKDGDVAWRPSMDLNKVILGGQVVAVVALLTIRSIVKAVLAAPGRDRARSVTARPAVPAPAR